MFRNELLYRHAAPAVHWKFESRGDRVRGRMLIAAAAMTAAMLGAEGATAAPVATIAGGPMRAPGGFAEENMHPIFTSCFLSTFTTPTSTTVATFAIRPNTHEAHFQITNSCGTYDETFRLGECVQFRPGQWDCDHTRNGFRAWATYSLIDGKPHLDAREYQVADPENVYWWVNGFLLAEAITTV